MKPGTRCPLWQAAGWLLAAACSPGLAQEVPKPLVIQTPPSGSAGSSAPGQPGSELFTPRATVILPPGADNHNTATIEAPVGPPCTGAGQSRHARCQANFWGYPEEFIPVPLGGAIYDHFRTQVANGEAARMVLYHFDFLCGSSALNLRGNDQLGKIALLLKNNTCPIIIERTPDQPALAEARRLAVLQVLGGHGIAINPRRVVVGLPLANGLSGVEANRVVYPSFLQNMAFQGQPFPIQSQSIGGNSAGSAGGTPPLGISIGSGGSSPGGSGLP